MRRLARLVAFTALCSGATGATGLRAMAQATFTDLGSLPGPYPLAEVGGISADGSTVVGMSWFRPFRWRAATGMVALERPCTGWMLHFSAACSQDGSVAVGHALYSDIDPPNPQQGMVWDRNGLATLVLDDPLCPNSAVGPSPYSIGTGVSADATAAVGQWHEQATLWRPLTERIVLGPAYSSATGVSANAAVVVGNITSGAFRWSDATGLVSLGANTRAAAVSADGQIVAGSSSAQASLWTAQWGWQTLGNIPGGQNGSEAMGVCANGWRAVGRGSTATHFNEAAVWDAAWGIRGVRDVLVKQHGLSNQLSGWALFLANAVSADGTAIAGTGTGPGSPSNYKRAWLARLPRCPGDYNRDGMVSPADITAFVSGWFQSLMDGNDWGDFDLDGVVTPADVAAFVKAWWVLVTTGSC